MIALWALTLTLFAVFQATNRPPNLIRSFCGNLVYQREVPQKNPSSAPKTKTSPMRGIQVVAYPYKEGASCCDGMTPVGSAVTARGGKFEFKGVAGGEYWMVVHANGHDARIHVSYEPLQRYPPSCPDYTFVFDGTDTLGLTLTIVVTENAETH